MLLILRRYRVAVWPGFKDQTYLIQTLNVHNMKTKKFIIFILTGFIVTSFQFDSNQNSDLTIIEDEIVSPGFVSVETLNPEAKRNTMASKSNDILSDDVLLSDFLELEFGMFIHYNMATYQNTQWVDGYPDPSEFDPGVEVIDTDAWADAAVAAGMKYAVLTAKHVGGFCLWDSEYTTYDVMHPDCPYQKDLVAQFVKSFHDRGLKVGLYYAWRHPGFDANRSNKDFKVLPPECDPSTHTMEEQIEFQKAQIAELITKYPEVFYVWNDALDPVIMEADEYMTWLEGVRPDILASGNWWDWSKKGSPYADIAVTEMRHFPEDNSAIGETCWMLEDKWFWNGDSEPKSAERIVELLKKVNGRNANLLLNVGPDKNGNIIESSVQTLVEIGKLRVQKN